MIKPHRWLVCTERYIGVDISLCHAGVLYWLIAHFNINITTVKYDLGIFLSLFFSTHNKLKAEEGGKLLAVYKK